jgi:hypothetical protein
MTNAETGPRLRPRVKWVLLYERELKQLADLADALNVGEAEGDRLEIALRTIIANAFWELHTRRELEQLAQNAQEATQ